jgi:hypothetical protein
MDDKRFQTNLIKRLNILISLSLEVASQNKPLFIAEKVHRLHELGLTPAEIGEVLTKPTNYVTAVLHKKMKKLQKKGVKNA